jgi:hypothetical protein
MPHRIAPLILSIVSPAPPPLRRLQTHLGRYINRLSCSLLSVYRTLLLPKNDPTVCPAVFPLPKPKNTTNLYSGFIIPQSKTVMVTVTTDYFPNFAPTILLPKPYIIVNGNPTFFTFFGGLCKVLKMVTPALTALRSPYRHGRKS